MRETIKIEQTETIISGHQALGEHHENEKEKKDFDAKKNLLCGHQKMALRKALNSIFVR